MVINVEKGSLVSHNDVENRSLGARKGAKNRKGRREITPALRKNFTPLRAVFNGFANFAEKLFLNGWYFHRHMQKCPAALATRTF